MRYRLSEGRQRSVLTDVLEELEAQHMTAALLDPEADLTDLASRIADVTNQLEALQGDE